MAPGPVRSLIESAVRQTKTTTGYTQNYFVIPYPNGDVPEETGACTDVVIRSFRAAGVDLQKEVHEDIAKMGISEGGHEHRPPPRAEPAEVF
jgi:hypothetical protein